MRLIMEYTLCHVWIENKNLSIDHKRAINGTDKDHD